MSADHYQEAWVLAQKGANVHIVSAWGGSYLTDGSWRISTPIVSFAPIKHGWVIETMSGTTYEVAKEAYNGCKMSSTAILMSVVRQLVDEGWMILDEERMIVVLTGGN